MSGLEQYNLRALIRPSAVFFLVVFLPGVPAGALAQDPPPPIGPFVIDARGSVPLFRKDVQLADSRALVLSELPGAGLGVDAGAHLYIFKWREVTVGLGAQLTAARSRATPPGASALRSVTETFTSFTPQLSLNFGTGHGWSYLSGGIGPARWSIVPDGAEPSPADEEQLRAINYGGGARWFARPRLAFTVDVRFHQIDPGTPVLGRAGSPRLTFIAIGAGVSLKGG